MKFFLVLLAATLAGCSETPEARKEYEQQVSEGFSAYMYRVEFDGHLWVMMKSSHAQPFVHHPDCPCGKLEKKP